METARIREARLADAEELAALCGQLGYPATTADVQTRLPYLLSSADDLLLVATDAGDRAIAWLHAVVRRQLQSGDFVQVAGLVVADAHRGSGIGARLLARAEEWAGAHGAGLVRLRCNVSRERTHGFYRRAGYTLAKTSHLFTKLIAGRR